MTQGQQRVKMKREQGAISDRSLVAVVSGSLPILYIYIHMYIFLMANKLCCSYLSI